MSECVKKFFRTEFKKDKLERLERGILEWEQLQWDIYKNMYSNLRAPFKKVAKRIGVSQQTVQYNLYRKVLPCCNVANFFFTLGYRFYNKILLQIDSEYEKSIVQALETFPCTTYIYPLEKGAILIVFHNNINDILKFIKKLEEKGLAQDILPSIPLAHYL